MQAQDSKRTQRQRHQMAPRQTNPYNESARFITHEVAHRTQVQSYQKLMTTGPPHFIYFSKIT